MDDVFVPNLLTKLKSLCYNENMKRLRHGFTLIEVALFLVVTGALFVGVTVGVQNSIYQQRTNDSVQSLVSFLRGIYSQTTNVENEGNGRTNKAVYGKLITFGESYDLSGQEIVGDQKTIFTYNIIGDIPGEGNNYDTSTNPNTLDALEALHANVVAEWNNDGTIAGQLTSSGAKPVGIAESYVPKWSAVIQKNDKYELFKGAIMVVRNPVTGSVSTYVKYNEETDNPTTVEVNRSLVKAQTQNIELDKILLNELRSFEAKQLDLCLNTNDNKNSGMRFDIRIVKGAKNSLGVDMVPTDSSQNVCEIGG